jgi:hypothetical protein
MRARVSDARGAVSSAPRRARGRRESRWLARRAEGVDAIELNATFYVDG